MNVFVAGASGVVGRALIPKLVAAGHAVTAMTRTPETATSSSGPVQPQSSATCSTAQPC